MPFRAFLLSRIVFLVSRSDNSSLVVLYFLSVALGSLFTGLILVADNKPTFALSIECLSLLIGGKTEYDLGNSCPRLVISTVVCCLDDGKAFFLGKESVLVCKVARCKQ